MRLVSFKKDGNKAKAVFSIDNSEFEDKVNIVWNRQKKWFRVPGFRKGKVPRGIIENEYGKDIYDMYAWIKKNGIEQKDFDPDLAKVVQEIIDSMQ